MEFNEVLCPKPWTTLHLNLLNHIGPCSQNEIEIVSDFNKSLNDISNDQKELRRQMLMGNRDSACHKCYYSESFGLPSLRDKPNVLNEDFSKLYRETDESGKVIRNPSIIEINLNTGSYFNRIMSKKSGVSESDLFRQVIQKNKAFLQFDHINSAMDKHNDIQIDLIKNLLYQNRSTIQKLVLSVNTDNANQIAFDILKELSTLETISHLTIEIRSQNFILPQLESIPTENFYKVIYNTEIGGDGSLFSFLTSQSLDKIVDKVSSLKNFLSQDKKSKKIVTVLPNIYWEFCLDSLANFIDELLKCSSEIQLEMNLSKLPIAFSFFNLPKECKSRILERIEQKEVFSQLLPDLKRTLFAPQSYPLNLINEFNRAIDNELNIESSSKYLFDTSEDSVKEVSSTLKGQNLLNRLKNSNIEDSKNLSEFIDPESLKPNICFLIGKKFFDLSDHTTSYKYIKSYLDRSPKIDATAKSLAWVLKDLKQTNLALDLHFRILKVYPHDKDTLNSLFSGGWINLTPENENLLKDFYNSRRTGNEAHSNKGMGLLLKTMENYNDSIQALLLAHVYLPADEEIQHALTSGGWDKLPENLQQQLLEKLSYFFDKRKDLYALKSMALLLKKYGRISEGLDRTLEALSVLPDDPDLINSVISGGWDELDHEELRPLIKWLEDCNANYSINKALALLYKKVGDIDLAAKNILEACMFQTPDSELIQCLNSGGWDKLKDSSAILNLMVNLQEDHSFLNLYLSIAVLAKSNDDINLATQFLIKGISTKGLKKHCTEVLSTGGWDKADAKYSGGLCEALEENPENLDDPEVRKQLALIYKKNSITGLSATHLLVALNFHEDDQELLQCLFSGGWDDLENQQGSEVLERMIHIDKKTSKDTYKKSIILLSKALEKIETSAEYIFKLDGDISDDNELLASISSGGWTKLGTQSKPRMIGFLSDLYKSKPTDELAKTLTLTLKEEQYINECFKYLVLSAQNELDEEINSEVLLSGGWDKLTESNKDDFLSFVIKHEDKIEPFQKFKLLGLTLKTSQLINQSFEYLLSAFNLSSEDSLIIKALTSGGWDKLSAENSEKLTKVLESIGSSVGDEINQKTLIIQYKKQGNLEEALSLLLREIDQFPNDEELLSLLNDGGWDKLDKTSMLRLAEFCKGKNLNNNIHPKLLKDIAFGLKGLGEYDLSMEFHLISLRNVDLYDEVATSLCTSKWEKCNEESLNLFADQLAANKPTKEIISIGLNRLARLYFERDKSEKARSLLALAILSDFNQASENILYGDLAAKLELNSLAIKSYERAIKLQQDNIEIIKLLGWLYKKERNYKKAFKSFKKIKVLDPGDTDAEQELRRMTSGVYNKFKSIFYNIG